MCQNKVLNGYCDITVNDLMGLKFEHRLKILPKFEIHLKFVTSYYKFIYHENMTFGSKFFVSPPLIPLHMTTSLSTDQGVGIKDYETGSCGIRTVCSSGLNNAKPLPIEAA